MAEPGAGRSRTTAGRERPEFKDEGIVLRTYKLGESDKILRIMTRGHGKRSAVAKGVRKTSSRFGARLEPLTHTKLFMHKGRGLDTVKQAEIVNSFQEVRDDLDLFVTASAMAELVDSMTEEGQPNEALFDLLLLGLQLIREQPEHSKLDLAMFQFKVMAEAGLEPMVVGCVTCGAADCAGAAFSLALGGLVCERCRAGRGPGAGKLVSLSSQGSLLITWIASHRLGERPRSGEEKSSAEIQALMGKVLEHSIQREMRSHRVAREMPRGIRHRDSGGS